MTDKAVMFDAGQLRFAIASQLAELRGDDYEATQETAAAIIKDRWDDLSRTEHAMLYRVFRLSANKMNLDHIVIMLYLCVYDAAGNPRLNSYGQFIGTNFIWYEVLGQKPKSYSNPLKLIFANYLRKLTINKSETEAQSLRLDLRASTQLLIQLFRDHHDWKTEVEVEEIA